MRVAPAGATKLLRCSRRRPATRSGGRRSRRCRCRHRRPAAAAAAAAAGADRDRHGAAAVALELSVTVQRGANTSPRWRRRDSTDAQCRTARRRTTRCNWCTARPAAARGAKRCSGRALGDVGFGFAETADAEGRRRSAPSCSEGAVWPLSVRVRRRSLLLARRERECGAAPAELGLERRSTADRPAARRGAAVGLPPMYSFAVDLRRRRSCRRPYPQPTKQGCSAGDEADRSAARRRRSGARLSGRSASGLFGVQSTDDCVPPV